MARSTHELSLLAPPIALRAVLACGMGLLWLAGCGPSANTPGQSGSSTPDVIVTVDSEHHSCVVALNGEPQGSTIACAELVPFVRDELRRASGSTYAIRTVGKVDDRETDTVESSLKGAGYRRFTN
jgi:hypothetical protein